MNDATKNQTRPSKGRTGEFIAIVLLMAAACTLVAVFAGFQGNWAIVVSEVPTIIGLVIVALLARTAVYGKLLVKVASIVGLICLVEAILLTFVFDVGTKMLISILAGSTLFVTLGLICYWLYERRVKTA